MEIDGGKTAAHCLGCCPDSYWFQNSLITYTGYNEWQALTNFSNVQKSYVYESFTNVTEWKDIAILDLEKPIGKKYGEVGINPIPIKEKSLMIVFFKFSYPAETNSDSTLKYTGEQMQIMYAESNKRTIH